MTDRLKEAVENFRMVDPEFRLQMLLEYAEKLPELPEELKEERDAGLNRVEECQSPTYLWVRVNDGQVEIHGDAPEEAPTVRGFLSLLVHTLDGGRPDEVADVPLELLRELGIASSIGMTRTRGLSAVLRRVKHEVEEQAETA